MKIELLLVVNGYRKFHLGFYDSGQEAVEAMKRDIAINSAIHEPRFRKSMSDDGIRIDYGAKTCCKLERSANAIWIIWHVRL